MPVITHLFPREKQEGALYPFPAVLHPGLHMIMTARSCCEVICPTNPIRLVYSSSNNIHISIFLYGRNFSGCNGHRRTLLSMSG